MSAETTAYRRPATMEPSVSGLVTGCTSAVRSRRNVRHETDAVSCQIQLLATCSITIRPLEGKRSSCVTVLLTTSLCRHQACRFDRFSHRAELIAMPFDNRLYSVPSIYSSWSDQYIKLRACIAFPQQLTYYCYPIYFQLDWCEVRVGLYSIFNIVYLRTYSTLYSVISFVLKFLYNLKRILAICC